MAKKIKKPWVTFDRDPKSDGFILSRRGEVQSERLQFPRPGDTEEARLVFGGDDANDPEGGLYLDYSTVQWLAQAIPELLNEMERVGLE
jgi:hypothetical protein